MKTIATLPPLEQGQVWFYHPAFDRWSPIEPAELVVLNVNRSANGRRPFKTGTPSAGSEVWSGLGYAIYQPEAT